MGNAHESLVRRLRGERIPLWLKIVYTAFCGALVPYYAIQYGPVNFLWFCDVALLITLLALWLESPILASMQAVAIVLPQLMWAVDFVVRLVAGVHIVNLTEYMFDPTIPLFVRGLSLFHGWLPFLLLWLVWRLGYDRRALHAQTLVCWLDLLLCYLMVDDPKGRAGNVNKILGMNDDVPQTSMSPLHWLALLMAAYPLCVYVPTNLVFWWLAPTVEQRAKAGAGNT
jgi:hypothetical protein